MLITFDCKHCNARLRIDSEAIGTELDCPECDNTIQVPNVPFGPGYVVGGFLIEQKIGQGGMGEVYLARQLSMQRDIALKILPPQFTRQGNFVVRFLKEVHFQAKLEHPNIVTAYEAGEDSGVYFMAMAYVKGETLEETLDREGSLPEQDALRITEQIADALRYAWNEHGLMHRDIKPGNIMVSQSGNAKILDMGLSKSVHDTRAITHADTLMGTPNYMSPEQIDRPQSVDFRSDMYALGMTLYHMLTGVVPFEDTSYLKTLKRQSEEQLSDPRQLMPGIHDGTVKLLQWMLARDENDRPESWEALLDALRGVRNRRPSAVQNFPEQSTVAFDPANDTPEDPPEQRHPARLLAAVAVAVAILGGLLAIFLSSSNRGQDPLSDPGTLAIVEPTAIPTPAPTSTPVPPTPLPPQPTPEDETLALQAELADLVLEYDRDPTTFDVVMEQLQDLGLRVKATPLSTEVMEQILRIRDERKAAIATEQEYLSTEIDQILASEGVEAARSFLASFRPEFRETEMELLPTLATRISVRETQEQDEQLERDGLAEKALADLENATAPLLLDFHVSDALAYLGRANTSSRYRGIREDDIAKLISHVEDLRGVPMVVLESFEEAQGEEIEIRLREGDTRSLRVLSAGQNGVTVQRLLRNSSGRILGSTEFILGFKDLHRSEIIQRLQTHQSHAANLFKGIMAKQNGSLEMAIHYFRLAGAPFGPQMASQLEILRVPIDLPSYDLLPELVVTNAQDGAEVEAPPAGPEF